ncbi:hypothetical protein JL722_13986 [Aureococcus anophagefferens]|nr:hypothetical protein JL722_13986 [Aureococcus anophagefferens]
MAELVDQAAGDGEQGSSRAGSREDVLQLVEQMRQSGSLGASSSTPAAAKGGDDASGVHKFWDTQPVPKLGESISDVDVNDVIEPNKPSSALRQEPFKMPEGFAWSDLDVTSEDILKEIYTLLNENYVEDDDAMFRFDYSMPFLEWALTPPNYDTSFHLGVRNERSGSKLMAFITGVPATAVVRGKPVRVVEINYLCVHKRLRTKRLAPVLIKEITRARNLKGVFQAAHALLSNYLSKFALAPKLDVDEFAHWVLPRPGVIDSFVVDDGTAAKNVTDLCSFYHLPSTVIGHEKHSTLKAAYSFYNVATSMPLQDLMRDALVCAKRVDMDVFNALNIMENDAFLKELKFGIGDGHLQYYLYNWKCAEMQPNDIGLVLLRPVPSAPPPHAAADPPFPATPRPL